MVKYKQIVYDGHCITTSYTCDAQFTVRMCYLPPDWYWKDLDRDFGNLNSHLFTFLLTDFDNCWYFETFLVRDIKLEKI